MPTHARSEQNMPVCRYAHACERTMHHMRGLKTICLQADTAKHDYYTLVTRLQNHICKQQLQTALHKAQDNNTQRAYMLAKTETRHQ